MRGDLQDLDLPEAETEYDKRSQHRDQVIFQALLMGVQPSVIRLIGSQILEEILAGTDHPFDPDGPGGGVIWNRFTHIQKVFAEGDWPGNPDNPTRSLRLAGVVIVKL